jgi:hypothetical protein
MSAFGHGWRPKKRKRLLDLARCRLGAPVAAVRHIHAHTNNAAVVPRPAGRLYNPTVQVRLSRGS